MREQMREQMRGARAETIRARADARSSRGDDTCASRRAELARRGAYARSLRGDVTYHDVKATSSSTKAGGIL